ncbi:MAG: hypothetical protein CL424_11170 [Acidimicrobiaceae bacterium]|nr:hypothetical protein [Acidimicrobiaceae bacterium]
MVMQADKLGNPIDLREAPLPVVLEGQTPDAPLGLLLGSKLVWLGAGLTSRRELRVQIEEGSEPGVALVIETGLHVTISSPVQVEIEVSGGPVSLHQDGASGCLVRLRGGRLRMPKALESWPGLVVRAESGVVESGTCERLELLTDRVQFHDTTWPALLRSQEKCVLSRSVDDGNFADVKPAQLELPEGVHVGEGVRLEVNRSAVSLELSGEGYVLIPEDEHIVSLRGEIWGLNIDPRAQLEAGALTVGTVQASPHTELSGAPLTITHQVKADQTAVFRGVEVPPISESLRVLDGLDTAQRVSLDLGPLSKPRPDREWAVRHERLIDAGRDLVDRRCADGRTRSAWRMQQLDTRAVLCESHFDRRLLRLMHVFGDAIDVRRCFLVWLGGVLLATPLLLLAIDGAGWGWNWSGTGASNLGKAVMVATLGVFTLVPSRGGVDLPTVAWWALPIKVVLTALLASFAASVVRRARWSPAPRR